MHSQCNIGQELSQLLPEVLPGIRIVVLPAARAHKTEMMKQDMQHLIIRSSIRDIKFISHLVVPVYEGCFTDEQLVFALKTALEAKKPIVLVHERDPEKLGCEFGVILDACPEQIKRVRGHSDKKLFDAIAVAWVRGPHIGVSSRRVALAL